MAGSYEEFEELRTSCIEDGLLARGFGGQLRITRKGREVVKLAAVVDEEVASALQDALRTPWLERRSALVALVLLAERGLRAAVIYRKLSLGSRSQGGERTIERLLSVDQTCRLQRRSLYAYLADALTAKARGDPVPTLT